jgi:hypothetical protein
LKVLLGSSMLELQRKGRGTREGDAGSEADGGPGAKRRDEAHSAEQSLPLRHR